MQITKHFRLSEFARSETASRMGIDNTIPETLIPNVRNLCEQVLEPLRQHIRSPVVVSSGYRCPRLNRAVGGVPNSQHMTGEAADIVGKGGTLQTLQAWASWIQSNCHFDQLIIEKSGSSVWLHVSCKHDLSRNRRMVRVVSVE